MKPVIPPTPAMNDQPLPSPALFVETINAFQKSAALQAALDLDLFTAAAGKPATAAELAIRCGAAERGMRILCDYLTILGFLEKAGAHYAPTQDTTIFLSRSSPAYVGGAIEFFLAPALVHCFKDLAAAVRQGGTTDSALGTIAPEHPIWVRFAEAMGPLMLPAAGALAELLTVGSATPAKVLDISAGHGMYGIEFARYNPGAQLVALDWAPVLAVTRRNGAAAGIADRMTTIAGSAFEIDLGDEYDVVLLPNFLHHFPPAQCVALLERVWAALRPGGQVAIVEFVPNLDRISPPAAAAFSLVMLATTPAGDAYTFAELAGMLEESRFKAARQHSLPPSLAIAVIAAKAKK